MAVSGVSFLVAINTGTTATPVWTNVAGQRDATLNLNTAEFDATTKDSANWHEGLTGIRDWDISFNNLFGESDTGLAELENAFLNNEQVQIKLTTAANNTYDGTATLTNYAIGMPYNDVVTANGTLKGSGPLNRTAAT